MTRVAADRRPPRRTWPGSIVASGAISTSASIQVAAGSTIVTPASMWRSAIWRRASAATAARSARLLTPRLTFGSSARWAATRQARLAQQRQHVAEVVLAGRVVVGEPVERVGERRGLEGVGAGVDLADREHLGVDAGRVLGLDDPLDVAVGVADDAPVGAGVVELDGHHRRARRRRSRCVASSSATISPEISGWSPERTTTVSESRTRSWAARIAPPVPSASGWTTVSVPSGRPGDEVAVGRDDHRHAVGARLARGEHRPGDHRPPADRVQHLRQRGAHPGSLARGHDQDGRAASRGPLRCAAHARNRRRLGASERSAERTHLRIAFPDTPYFLPTATYPSSSISSSSCSARRPLDRSEHRGRAQAAGDPQRRPQYRGAVALRAWYLGKNGGRTPTTVPRLGASIRFLPPAVRVQSCRAVRADDAQVLEPVVVADPVHVIRGSSRSACRARPRPGRTARSVAVLQALLVEPPFQVRPAVRASPRRMISLERQTAGATRCAATLRTDRSDRSKRRARALASSRASSFRRSGSSPAAVAFRPTSTTPRRPRPSSVSEYLRPLYGWPRWSVRCVGRDSPSPGPFPDRCDVLAVIGVPSESSTCAPGSGVANGRPDLLPRQRRGFQGTNVCSHLHRTDLGHKLALEALDPGSV